MTSYTNSQVIFDADYAAKGFTAYDSVVPPHIVIGDDLTIVRDPLGSRQVALFDNKAEKFIGTKWARASASSADIVEPGNVYRATFEFLVPESDQLQADGDWASLGTGGWGRPWVGIGNLRSKIIRGPDGKTTMVMGPDGDRIVENIPFEYGRWTTIVITYRFDYPDADPGGWLEVEVNGKQYLPRTTVATRAYGSNDEAPNTTRVGIYASQVMRVYCAVHRLELLTAD